MLKYILGPLLLFFIMPFATAQVPNYHSNQLKEAADLDHHQPIGVSVSAENRLFVSFPRWGSHYEYGLTEIVNGKRIPYPNREWNINKSGPHSFYSIQDLYVDKNNFLWVLDSRPGSGGPKSEGKFKLLKINLKTNKVEKIYPFDDLDKTRSALNDVRIDTDKDLAYLSDPGLAAIVVLNLKTGKSRVLLAGSKVTSATPGVVLCYEGKEMRNKNGQPFVSNINGIALTHDNRYFYFKPINSYHLYRIATKYLADTALSDKALLEQVEFMGSTIISHGLLADKKGNIYLTSSTDYSIKYLSPDGILHTLVQDKRILWPDSMGIGSDGYLYFSCAQINRLAGWNHGKNKVKYPYRIYKIPLPQ